MDYVFKYVVLTAIPDRGRGERVNIGIVVFGPERADIRFAEIEKMRALTGSDWKGYAEDLKARLLSRFSDSGKAIDEVKQSRRIDPYFEASDVAWFSISDASEYETAVNALMKSMVLRPQDSVARVKASRLNTQVTRVLKQAKALAKRDDPIEDHRVHRDIEIEEELSAEFAQKNGVWRVAATLDCTLATGLLKEASLKSVTLDRAKVRFGQDTKLIGIYAPSRTDDKNARAALHIFQEYSELHFNWDDVNERQRLINFFHAGMNVTGPLM